MQIDELKKLAYHEGFIESFIEITCETMLQTQEHQSLKHAEEVSAAWKLFVAGVAKLRAENQAMINKLALIQQGLNT